MKRFEKFEYLKNKGWKYDPETGKIFNSRGSRSFSKNAHGYVICKITLKDKQFALYGHHFAWYWVHGNVRLIRLITLTETNPITGSQILETLPIHKINGIGFVRDIPLINL